MRTDGLWAYATARREASVNTGSETGDNVPRLEAALVGNREGKWRQLLKS